MLQNAYYTFNTDTLMDLLKTEQEYADEIKELVSKYNATHTTHTPHF